MSIAEILPIAAWLALVAVVFACLYQMRPGRPKQPPHPLPAPRPRPKMEVQMGYHAVFGIEPHRPIGNIPEGVQKVRVRLRFGKAGRAFVKFPDRIEQWVLGYECEYRKEGRWWLRWKEAVNYTTTPTPTHHRTA